MAVNTELLSVGYMWPDTRHDKANFRRASELSTLWQKYGGLLLYSDCQEFCPKFGCDSRSQAHPPAPPLSKGDTGGFLF